MSWGHDELELDEDADERAIKRAYAKRLRVTRPDDDPQAFQQLHEAYQAALAWAQHRQQWQEDADAPQDTFADSAPPLHDVQVSSEGVQACVDLDRWLASEALPAERDPVRTVDGGGTFHSADAAPDAQPGDMPAALPPEHRLDVESFVQRLLEEGCTAAPPAFAHWLRQQPELWSLQDKPQIAEVLLWQLLHGDATLPAESFDVLASEFGWDEVGSGVDPFEAARCRLRMHRRWLLLPQHHDALADFLSTPNAAVDAAQAVTRLERLTRPWHAWQALWSAWPRGRGLQMRQTLAALGVDHPTDTTPPLRAEQVAFWLSVADSHRMSWPRMQVALLRSALAGSVLAISFSWLATFTHWVEAGGANAFDLGSMLQISLASGATVFVLGTLMPPLRSLLQWQTADAGTPVRWGYLCAWLVPLLALVSVLVIDVADQREAGTVLAWCVLGLGVARWWVRGNFELRFNGWMLLALVPFPKIAGLALLVGEIAVGLGMLAWLADGVRTLRRR